MAARQILQSEKADVNNDLPVGFAITELVSSSCTCYKAQNTSWVLYG